MKRILLISNYIPGMGGIHAQVEMLYYHLNKEDGIEAHIFSTKGNPLKRIWKMISLLCVVKRYDLLHIHACSYRGMLPAVMGIIAGKLWRKRIVITYHGGEAKEYFAKHIGFARKWLGKADAVIVLSGFLKEVFDYYAIPCVVIPNILLLRPAPIRNNQQVLAPKFISVRHLEPLYNIPCILKAYKLVLEYYPSATLDILGKGSMRTELEQYVIDNNLTGVRFIGQVPNTEIYNYLDNANIILSSPVADNMPVSILEAMNAGLLVISSRVGGVPYMIDDGKTGLLFTSDNDQELAEKMLWALAHTDEVNQIVARAQEDVKQYVWENVKEKLMKVYG